MSDTIEQVKEVADKTVTDKLNESLIKMIEGLEDGAAFLGAELPEFINQLLMWRMLESLINLVIGVGLITLSVYSVKWCYNLCKKSDKDYKEGEAWTRHSPSYEITSNAYDSVKLGYLIPVILFAIGLCCINLTWLQIWIAPKVWLVEYATTLVK